MDKYIEKEFNPCDVCDYKRCSNCILHELAMKAVGHLAADVALVVHGRWKSRPMIVNTTRLEVWMCSVCGVEKTRTSIYCPNCGARMDGGDKDD